MTNNPIEEYRVEELALRAARDAAAAAAALLDLTVGGKYSIRAPIANEVSERLFEALQLSLEIEVLDREHPWHRHANELKRAAAEGDIADARKAVGRKPKGRK